MDLLVAHTGCRICSDRFLLWAYSVVDLHSAMFIWHRPTLCCHLSIRRSAPKWALQVNRIPFRMAHGPNT